MILAISICWNSNPSQANFCIYIIKNKSTNSSECTDIHEIKIYGWVLGSDKKEMWISWIVFLSYLFFFNLFQFYLIIHFIYRFLENWNKYDLDVLICPVNVLPSFPLDFSGNIA